MMTKDLAVHTRFCGHILLAFVALVVSGCYQSPQQRLVGRWYNGDMSVRFREDGSVIMNSTTGLARGRYQFVPTDSPLGAKSGQENLWLDVVRNGRRTQLVFEAEFLARDRLRLQDHTRNAANGTTQSIRQFALLRRAAEADVQASASR